ncbi:hypothetical protein HN51_045276 [Arachis hypogaea]
MEIIYIEYFVEQEDWMWVMGMQESFWPTLEGDNKCKVTLKLDMQHGIAPSPNAKNHHVPTPSNATKNKNDDSSPSAASRHVSFSAAIGAATPALIAAAFYF